MLKKSRKLLLSVAALAMLIVCFGTTAFAASYYTGPLYNTGQTFNEIYSCAQNMKTLTGVDWKIRASYVENMQGYGIRFQPVIWDTRVAYGGQVWISSASATFKYADGSTMPVNEWYILYARIDDDYPGWMHAQGYWNAN